MHVTGTVPSAEHSTFSLAAPRVSTPFVFCLLVKVTLGDGRRKVTERERTYNSSATTRSSLDAIVAISCSLHFLMLMYTLNLEKYPLVLSEAN